MKPLALAFAVVLAALAGAAEPFADPLASDGHGPAMVLIDIGPARMGHLPGDQRCRNNEPAHDFLLREPFAMSRDEITVAEFERFALSTGYVTSAERRPPGQSVALVRGQVPHGTCVHSSFWGHAPSRASTANWREPGFAQSADHPAVCINHDDATAYAGWLAKETGQPYKLPSEAQWEYAARYQRADEEVATHQQASSEAFHSAMRSRGRTQETSPVGLRPANILGIRGLDGYDDSPWVVAEWTRDCWNDSYEGAPRDGSAWLEGDCSQRVQRGYGFLTCRGAGRPSVSSTATGVRVVRAPMR